MSCLAIFCNLIFSHLPPQCTGPCSQPTISIVDFARYSTRFRMESAWTSTGHVVQWESMTHIKPLKDLVEPGWAQALADVEPQIHLMGDFLRSEIAAGRKYLPASRNILRAFTIPFDDIKVLIVGQDPYPTPGHPVGLSFCVAPDVKPIPRSLANIYTELTDDLGVPMPGQRAT